MSINDPYETLTTGLSSPICGGFDITPHETNDLTVLTRAIMVGTAGDVSVRLQDGTTVTLSLSSGVIYPLRICKLFVTGTTAAQIVGLY